MIIFIEITTFLFGVLICPILAFLTLYKVLKSERYKLGKISLIIICTIFSCFYWYEVQPNEQIIDDNIPIVQAKNLSDKEIVDILIHKKLECYKNRRLFNKDKILDYEINRISDPIKNIEPTTNRNVYYSISYSLKVINSYWNTRNGFAKGLWIKNKSDYYELKKKDDAYTLEYVGGL